MAELTSRADAGRHAGARALGVDLGRRRIGLALSDVSGTLARPFKTLTVTPADALTQLIGEIDRLAASDDGLAVVVVGIPIPLNGGGTGTNAATQGARKTMDDLRARTSVPIVGEDERLTSREAEQRLAVRERDWRVRKQRLDAAAAAILLQDYLDRHARPASVFDPDEDGANPGDADGDHGSDPEDDAGRSKHWRDE